MKSAGFTLIELLVVITVITILAGMLLPAIKLVRDSSRGTVCLSNLRQVGMAMNSYALDNEDQIPPPYLVDRSSGSAVAVNFQASVSAGVPSQNWYGALVGLLENNQQQNASKVYACPMSCFPTLPSRRGWGLSYGYNTAGAFLTKVMANSNSMQRGVTISTFAQPSTQILITERWGADPNGNALEGWDVRPPYEYAPLAPPLVPGGKDSTLRISHRGGSNYLLLDGHVEYLTPWKPVSPGTTIATEKTEATNWWVGIP